MGEREGSEPLSVQTDNASTVTGVTPNPVTPSVDDDEERRHCWVCFATDDDDDHSEAWVRPCRCRGTTKWVHRVCLQRWIDEKQRGNVATAVSCPQCNTEYLILYPPVGTVVYIMDIADRIIYKVCPFVAAGIVVGSVYWTAVTYGAITVMQVLGHKEGLNVMEAADPLFLLVGLPTIPIILILGKMVRWEDRVLNLWRKHAYHIPIISFFAPHYRESGNESIPPAPPLMNDPLSATRILCGALMIPTISTLIGRLFFDSVESNLQRTFMGFLTYVAVKGTFRMYHKQQQYVRQMERRILNFEAGNAALPPRSRDGSRRNSASVPS